MDEARGLVDYAKTLDCIHCGLCLNTCPTYRLTGKEASSPRGRIHLMRSVHEGVIPSDATYSEELDFCLLCRNCESVCPSGVRFGALMEHARAALEPVRERPARARLARRVGFDLLLRDRAALRVFTAFGRFAQSSGLASLAAKLGGARARGLAEAPRIPPASERGRLPEFMAARAPRVGAVALLEGCVMPELLGRTNRATASLLAKLGFDVHVAREHVCCGSLHAHNGERDGARALAQETLDAFDRLVDERGAPLPLVVNSAGCGSHLKELAHLFEGGITDAGTCQPTLARAVEASDAHGGKARSSTDGTPSTAHDPRSATRAPHASHGASASEPVLAARSRALAARTFDLSVFLSRPDVLARLRDTLSRTREPLRATWDDPCHLCHGQGVRAEPRTLLRAIPGLELVEMPDAELCCGSAGIYSLTRPADAAAVLAPKLESLRRSGARVLVTANPGCQLQWRAGVERVGLDVRVAHLAELLDEAVTPA